MAAPSGSSPTGQWMKYLTDSVDLDGDGAAALENMLGEQQSACQEIERASSRAIGSSAAEKDQSQCKDQQFCNENVDCRRGSAAGHKRQREDPSEASSSKANREKMRRDRLNDRFVELARSLEGSGQSRADRGSILADAVRVLAQLRAETAELRGAAEQMKEQIRELKAEKGELREEKARLQANKEQLEDQVRRMAASGAAQSTLATSAAASGMPLPQPAPAAVAPGAPSAPSAPAVPMLMHQACEAPKLAALGAPMGMMPMPILAAPACHNGQGQQQYILPPHHPGSGHYSAPSHPAGGGVSVAPQFMTPMPVPGMVPGMAYGMPGGVQPMAMWQWLPRNAVDTLQDQMLRPPVA